MRRLGTVAFRSAVGLTVIFLLAPALVVVAMSFSDTAYLSFPPEGLGLRAYRSLLSSDLWGPVTLRSLVIALPVALLAVGAATLLVIGLARTRLPYKNVLVAFSTLPLLVPGVALAVAVYGLLARLRILDTYLGIILAHAVTTLPLAVLILWPAIRAISSDLELAAMTLGARRARAWWDTTVRLLGPSVGAAMITVFLTSFDEAVLVSFISGPQTTTLPKAILDSVTTGLDPTITAIATLLILLTAVLMAAGEALRRRSERR
ncbi:ABC transporter permease [Nonomuraea sp. NPDC050643]|uniref:ABC transporter permease n=1 Tax=Nonomuraea sp. NPDC050643 TaxID=3155660 RepID=UPI0033F208D4